MREMQHLLKLNLTIWSEGVREIVSAKESDIKFMITDNPVTLYNSACPPDAPACRYPIEPSVQWNGTQTIFPLDSEHCLVLSHVDYANQADGLDLLAERQNARHFGKSLVRTDAWIRSGRCPCGLSCYPLPVSRSNRSPHALAIAAQNERAPALLHRATHSAYPLKQPPAPAQTPGIQTMA